MRTKALVMKTSGVHAAQSTQGLRRTYAPDVPGVLLYALGKIFVSEDV